MLNTMPEMARRGWHGTPWRCSCSPRFVIGAVAELTANWPMSPAQLCSLECQLFDQGAL
jgi:hypothetical protein